MMSAPEGSGRTLPMDVARRAGPPVLLSGSASAPGRHNDSLEKSTRAANQFVHIVDDDPAVVITLAALLGSEDIPAIGYESAPAFLKGYSPTSRGCLLVDVHMPGTSGLDLQEQLAASDISWPIIMITGRPDVATAVLAMKQGALDFIEKPFDYDSIIRTVRQALALDVQLNAKRVNALMVSSRLALLTERERAILDMAARGNSTKEIARAFGISPRTVDAHRANILRKLNVKSVADLFRAVLPLGARTS
jgi:two-component system response regulator FixJ